MYYGRSIYVGRRARQHTQEEIDLRKIVRSFETDDGLPEPQHTLAAAIRAVAFDAATSPVGKPRARGQITVPLRMVRTRLNRPLK